MENDYAWDYSMTTFDSEGKAGKDTALNLSSSEQNGSTNDSARDQPQTGPETRFGFGWGVGVSTIMFIDETVTLWDLPAWIGRGIGRGRGRGRDLTKFEIQIWKGKLFQ